MVPNTSLPQRFVALLAALLLLGAASPVASVEPSHGPGPSPRIALAAREIVSAREALASDDLAFQGSSSVVARVDLAALEAALELRLAAHDNDLAAAANAAAAERAAIAAADAARRAAAARAAAVRAAAAYVAPVVRNHFWFPALGISRPVYTFLCSRSGSLANYVYRWGCAGQNNVFLLGHAGGVFKPLHDAYVSGRLRVGMVANYADRYGHVTRYRVTEWRVVSPAEISWAIASQRVPSMTLQTCIGSQSQYRLLVRLVSY